MSGNFAIYIYTMRMKNNKILLRSFLFPKVSWKFCCVHNLSQQDLNLILRDEAWTHEIFKSQ